VPRIARADFDSWAAYYLHYQAALARGFLVPFMEEHGVTLAGARLLDVGCGNGGCTAAFAERAESCLGIDIGDFPWVAGPNLAFRKGDILDASVARSIEGQFDIVVLRDVIEHIGDKSRLMAHVRGAIRGSGHALVTFPPFYSPFGAHQQVVLRGSALRYAPFVHWHPSLRQVVSTRVTVAGFEKLVRRFGMRVRARRLYVIHPSLELRYGLPTIVFPLPWVAGAREVFCSGAAYLLDWAR
jgi:SAM-dependent methyltransferase